MDRAHRAAAASGHGPAQAALPDLAGRYGLSEGPLGALLTTGFAIALPVMLVSGRLLDRWGARWGIGAPARRIFRASGPSWATTSSTGRR